jgi:subfamily B ATP-binding cassette protein HlyB/CyaB
LHAVSLDIRAGEVIGIVGRSGSGKSRLTKLIQRLYSPEQGRVLVDGIDMGLIDAAQTTPPVAPPDRCGAAKNFLFNRSVRENIAIADPAAPPDHVIRVARMAGAHEFNSELPEGYDTIVGEQGTGLSGSQRQRIAIAIAIARALFTNPRILILDEVTRALDYESEAILHKNMGAIAQGRTVIVIAIRLSVVRHAHRIVNMEPGRIAEAGTHQALLARQGVDARLWALQHGAQGPPDPAPPTADLGQQP